MGTLGKAGQGNFLEQVAKLQFFKTSFHFLGKTSWLVAQERLLLGLAAISCRSNTDAAAAAAVNTKKYNLTKLYHYH